MTDRVNETSTTPTAKLAPILTLSRDEIDRVRQWFEAVQDISPAYLEHGDFDLAQAIYVKLGMRVPLSVVRGLS